MDDKTKSKLMDDETESILMDDKNILYICLEAEQNKGGQQQQHVYVICSVKLKDLTASHSPTLTKEAFFEGYPSMGCGVFQSKIVFAGGIVQEAHYTQEVDIEEIKHDGFITFDMNSKQVSTNSFPSMHHGKVKPLVFQLDGKLYVMDTISGYHKGPYEYFYPKKQEWRYLRQPEYDTFKDLLSRRHHRNYPCVVIGHTCYLSMPHYDVVYSHHSNITYKAWTPCYLEPLPFSGVATFYYQDGFDDFVVISFTNGLVQAHRFHMFYCFLETPQELFKLPSSSESDEEMSGYFADFGGGIFSLVASDNVRVYVRIFRIFRPGFQTRVRPDKPMDLEFKLLSHHEYKFDALSFGADILGVVGCFAPSPNDRAINHAECVLDNYYHSYGRRCDDDPEIFEVYGVKFTIPDELTYSGNIVSVRIDTPMEPDPVEVICVLAK